jgi:membrane protease YdiL (CAAX protease family)
MSPELDPDGLTGGAGGPQDPADPGGLAGPGGYRPLDGRAPVSLTHRIVALLEVVLCSDYPTQAALGTTFAAFGYQPYVGGRLQIGFVAWVSLFDSVLLVGLMALFLYAHGERVRDVFLGRRRILSEIRLGMPLILVALGIAFAVLATIRRYAPSLHTVETNPLEQLMRTPKDAWLFTVIVVVAGGIREELQRAFLIGRFERWLGGATFGAIATSVAFGAGHLIQGADAVIATGALGIFWAFVYLWRRSVVAPMFSHAGFNLLQTAQYLAGT